MNDQTFALKMQGVFQRLQENLAHQDYHQMRFDPDRNVYLLVVAGQQAKLTYDFLAAVMDYASLVQGAEAEKEAREVMMTVLDEFASKVTLRTRKPGD